MKIALYPIVLQHIVYTRVLYNRKSLIGISAFLF